MRQYKNLSDAQNTTLRIGSLASTYFSIDNHPLTIVEADGTSVEPRIVNDIFIAAAQVCLLTIPCNEI